MGQARALWRDTTPTQPTIAQAAVSRGEGPAEALDGQDEPISRPYIGVAVASDTVEIAAPSDGVIAELAVEVGSRVRQGERIARLGDAVHLAKIEVADAMLQGARAEVKRSQLSAELTAEIRDEEVRLEASGVSARSARARAEIEHRIATAAEARARASVHEAEAGRELERARLAELEVIAPLDGTIEVRHVSAGAFVTRGAPLVRLVGNRRIVRFMVPVDHAIPEVGTSVTVLLPHAQGRRACVTAVASEIDPAAQSLSVEAELPAGPESIASGRRVEVVVPDDAARLHGC